LCHESNGRMARVATRIVNHAPGSGANPQSSQPEPLGYGCPGPLSRGASRFFRRAPERPDWPVERLAPTRSRRDHQGQVLPGRARLGPAISCRSRVPSQRQAKRPLHIDCHLRPIHHLVGMIAVPVALHHALGVAVLHVVIAPGILIAGHVREGRCARRQEGLEPSDRVACEIGGPGPIHRRRCAGTWGHFTCGGASRHKSRQHTQDQHPRLGLPVWQRTVRVVIALPPAPSA